MNNNNILRWLLFSAIAIFIFALPGCNFFTRYIENSEWESVPKDEPLPFAEIEEIECIPDKSNYEVATLISVIDGDSIKVEIEGELFQVRYIGIDTPEYNSDQRDKAIDAAKENERLLAGSTIYLFKDKSNTDKYDRLLRYVIANNRFVNLELVRSNHALSKTYKPDISCQYIFNKAALE